MPTVTSSTPRRRVRATLVATLAGLSVAGASLVTAGDAMAYPRGYVQDANLRAQPNTTSAVLARITNQYVEIECYKQGEYALGTAKWFRAHYYSSVGYLNANTVTQQPAVGACSF